MRGRGPMTDARRTAAMMSKRWPDAIQFVKKALASMNQTDTPHEKVRDAAVECVESLAFLDRGKS
jgi:hypothetical protein